MPLKERLVINIETANGKNLGVAADRPINISESYWLLAESSYKQTANPP